MTKVVWWLRSQDPQNSGFESGFNISQQIFRNNEHPSGLTQGMLPQCPRIPSLFSLWLEQYRNLDQEVRSKRISFNHSVPTNIAQSEIEVCGDSMRSLELEMQQWLDNTDSGWRKIREELRGELGNSSSKTEIRIMIRADEPLIWQLPWQFWNLLSLSPTKRKVRITFGHL